MKKILIFSTAYVPFIGGAEIAVKEIVSRIDNFSAKGGPSFGWDMITARMDKKLPKFERVGNINVYRIGFGIAQIDKYFLAFYGHKFARKLHKKNNYCLAWSVMASYAGFAALFFKKNNPGVPFLLTIQEGDDIGYIKKRAGVLAGSFLEIFRRADYVQCISHFLADWAKANGAKSPVEVVPNGVDIENFTRVYPEADLLEVKKKLNKGPGDIFLITTSRLVKKNAVDDIIKGLQKMPDNVKLLILGVGPEERNLRSQVENSGLRNRVVFLGHIEYKEIPKYLKVSDIFVRPSLSEGLGNSFLEAMAAGIPVIGTAVGGIPDFLKDGETGLFCEIKNSTSIAEKVKILMDDKILREKIVLNAKKLVVENYDWDLVAGKMSKIFEKLANK